jgi:hypothetical protein
VTTTIRALRSARSLDALLVLLRDLPTGDDLTLALEQETTQLRSFGGPEPRSTSGVWSWDATRVLVGTCPADFEIVARPICSFPDCSRVADTAGCGSGLCATHYQQQRRHGETASIRAPADHRLGVRDSAATFKRLRSVGAAATVARRVLEEWASR